jgi:hypothetical protein
VYENVPVWDGFMTMGVNLAVVLEDVGEEIELEIVYPCSTQSALGTASSLASQATVYTVC